MSGAAATVTAREKKGRSGFQPKSGEMKMRAERTAIRHIKRKLKAGRPGRASNAPAPTFDWATVTTASQKRHWREGDNRKPKGAR